MPAFDGGAAIATNEQHALENDSHTYRCRWELGARGRLQGGVGVSLPLSLSLSPTKSLPVSLSLLFLLFIMLLISELGLVFVWASCITSVSTFIKSRVQDNLHTVYIRKGTKLV